eukprot:SAG31_NODE_2041_length_6590_cov_2.334155_3_plen_110_part_00
MQCCVSIAATSHKDEEATDAVQQELNQRRLNLWKLHLQSEANKFQEFLYELMLFVPVLILLGSLTALVFPNASISLQQKVSHLSRTRTAALVSLGIAVKPLQSQQYHND